MRDENRNKREVKNEPIFANFGAFDANAISNAKPASKIEIRGRVAAGSDKTARGNFGKKVARKRIDFREFRHVRRGMRWRTRRRGRIQNWGPL